MYHVKRKIRLGLSRNILAACAWFALLCASVHASMWVDPSFEEMTSNATLIAVCEIIEGGNLTAKAKVLEVVKGERPAGPILVGDFNNENWPEYAIEKESLKKGERYLLFLQPGKFYTGSEVSKKMEDYLQMAVKKGEMTEDDLVYERRRLGEPKYAKGYRVPTPSTGDYPVKTNTVMGSWHNTSHPGSHPAVPLPLAVELITGLVEHQAGKNPLVAKQRLAKRLTVEEIKKTAGFEETKNLPGAAYRQFARLDWMMCAQAAYGDSSAPMADTIQTAAEHPWVGLNVLAGKALRSLDETPSSLQIAKTLLSSKHSMAQTEAAQSLVAGRFTAKGAGPLVLAAIGASKSNRRAPGNIMDPIRNVSSSGREAMIRAVTHFGLAAEAHDDLIKLLRDEGLNPGVFEALRSHFLKFPSDKARDRFIELAKDAPPHATGYFIDYFFEDRSTPSLRQIEKTIRDNKIDAGERAQWLERLYLELGIEHPILNRTLTTLAKRKQDEQIATSVLSLLIIRNAREDQARIKRLFEDKRMEDYDLEESVRLLLYLHPDSTMTEDTLLHLMTRFPSGGIDSSALLLPTPKVVAQLKRSEQAYLAFIKEQEKAQQADNNKNKDQGDGTAWLESFMSVPADGWQKRPAVTKGYREHYVPKEVRLHEHKLKILKAIELKCRPPASSRERLDGWISMLDAARWHEWDLLLPQLLWVQEPADKQRLAAVIRGNMTEDYQPILHLRMLEALSVASADELEALKEARPENLLDSQWGSILRRAKK